MAKDTRLANATAIAMCDVMVDLIDAGDTNDGGMVRIYSGSPPSNVDASETGTLLAEFELPVPAFGNAVDLNPGARATANAIDEVEAVGTGDAGYYRAYDRDENVVSQGTCGTSDANMVLPTVAITTGQPVRITSWTVTQPEAAS